ncbi:hypothetical protein HDU93_006433, partial [Gonapodya sp. JEL0774]
MVESEAEIVSLTARLCELQDAMEQKERDVTKSRTMLHEASEKLQAAHVEIESLQTVREELARCRKSLEDAHKSNAEFCTVIVTREKELSAAAARETELSTRLTQYTQTVKTLEEDIDSLAAKLTLRDQEVHNLNTDLTNAKDESAAKALWNDECDRKITQLDAEIADLTGIIIPNLKRELADSEAKSDLTEARALEMINQTVAAHRQETNDIVFKYTKEMELRDRQLQAAEDAVADQILSGRELGQDLDQLRDLVTAYALQVEREMVGKMEAEGKLSAVQLELETSTFQLQSAKETLEALRQRNSDLTTENKNLEASQMAARAELVKAH